MIRVLAAVIQDDRGILVCQRPAEKRHGGLWEFPGGKIEPRETNLDAARRELMEELGVHVTAVGRVDISIHDAGSEFVIDFLPVEIEGEPMCIEHSAHVWAAVEELLELPLAPSDRKYAEYLRSRSDIRDG